MKGEKNRMSPVAALLDRLGRPGGIRLGTTLANTAKRLPTGLPPLDALLGGGLPRGRLSEIAGKPGAGRTALACAIAAAATARGEIVGWVDPEDALDPETAATAGLHLERVLWVRPRRRGDARRAAELLLEAEGFGLVVLDLTGSTTATRGHRPGPAGPVWIRLARAAARTGSTLLVLATRRQTGPAAALGLELGPHRARWSGGRGKLLLLDGVAVRVTVARSRSGDLGRALVVRHTACA